METAERRTRIDRLARLAAAGDRQALAEIATIERERLFRIARAVLGSDDDAVDAVSEALLRMVRNIGTWTGTGPFSGWLSSLGYHVAVDLLRARRTAPDPLPDVEDERQGAAPSELTPASGPALRDAVRALPQRQREILRLKHDAGLKLREIASMLDVSVGTVAATLARAYRTLRTLLEPRMPSGENHGCA
jgi:RNA polymerase sigma-70 factor (ECF subfamily)